VIYLIRNRFVGVLYGWLRIITSKPRLSKFLGTTSMPGSFKVVVS